MNIILSKAVVGAMLFAGAVSAQAASCRVIHWKPDAVLTINSALYLGTRVELPADNLIPPVSSSELWNAEGAANQVMIKPNSDTVQGKSGIIRIWTTDGNSYDVVANRASGAAQNDVCVKIVADGMFFTPGARQALNGQSSNMARGPTRRYTKRFAAFAITSTPATPGAKARDLKPKA